MSNISAITGKSKIVNLPSGGGSKKQGSAVSMVGMSNTFTKNAMQLRANGAGKNMIFCMNQLGGVGAGGIPTNSYRFNPSADGTHCQGYPIGNTGRTPYVPKGRSVSSRWGPYTSSVPQPYAIPYAGTSGSTGQSFFNNL